MFFFPALIFLIYAHAFVTKMCSESWHRYLTFWSPSPNETAQVFQIIQVRKRRRLSYPDSKTVHCCLKKTALIYSSTSFTVYQTVRY